VRGLVYVGSEDASLYALNAKSGAKIWSYTTGDNVFSSPAIWDGVVYVGSGDYSVYALKALTGTEIWNYTTGSSVESSPAVSNGTVYVGSVDDSVYALNAVTGAIIYLGLHDRGVLPLPCRMVLSTLALSMPTFMP